MPRPLEKQVTEKEIRSGRISIPASVRDHLFRHVAQNSKTPFTMVDEKGDSYGVVLRVRKNRTKPEIMAKGGRNFSHKRQLKPGDVLAFSPGESPELFRVRVQKRGRRAIQPHHPAAGLGAVGFQNDFGHAPDEEEPPPPPVETVPPGIGVLSAWSQPSAPTVTAFDYLTEGSDQVAMGLGLSTDDSTVELLTKNTAVELSLSIGSNHTPTPPVATELGLSIGSDRVQVEKPPTPPVGPKLGLLTGSDRARLEPPPTPPVGLEIGLSIGNSVYSRLEQPPTPPLRLELGLSFGSKHAPSMEIRSSAAKTLGKVKAEVQEVDGPTLELTLGSPPAHLKDQSTAKSAEKLSFSDMLQDLKFSAKPESSKLMEQNQLRLKPPQGVLLGPAHPEAAYLPVALEMQETKPPTALVTAPPAGSSVEFDFSAILSHKPLEPIPKPSEVIVPGALVAKAKAQKAFEDPKVAAARGSCWIDFSTPYNEVLKEPTAELVDGRGRMLAEPTTLVVRGMGQPSGAGML